MASIDHPEGKPRVRWKDPDGTPHAKTCRTELAARELLRAVQHCEDTGKIWKPESRIEAPSLRAIAGRWVEALNRTLAPRTVERLVQMGDPFLDWYEERHGKDAGPRHLSRSTVEAYWEHVRTPATGRYLHRRTETTARKHIEAIHLLWEWAADREEYADRVLGEEAVPRCRKMTLPRRPATTPRVAPTWAEMDMAIDAAEGWRRCVLIVMRCTGLRVQQAMGLRWDDVDGDHLTIRGELGKMPAERVGRRIPVAPVLLAEWRSPRLAAWTDPAWIVPCRTGWDRADSEDRVVRSRDIAAIWSRTRAREAAWRGRPDHAFRAGFQTGVRALGASREASEYLVGHALPGLDASYIDVDQVFKLPEAVALVPAIVAREIAASSRARA